MATPNGRAQIETNGKEKHDNGVCHDDTSAAVRAQTIDELHSLQRKRSAPTTPIKDGAASPFAAALSEEKRHRQQLQCISVISHKAWSRMEATMKLCNVVTERRSVLGKTRELEVSLWHEESREHSAWPPGAAVQVMVHV